MKTKEELVKLKEEYETLKGKLSELSEDEVQAITGGYDSDTTFDIKGGPGQYEQHFYGKDVVTDPKEFLKKF